MFNGKTIVKETPNRFYNSIQDLTIRIKPTPPPEGRRASISKNKDKILVNNEYQPIHIDPMHKKQAIVLGYIKKVLPLRGKSIKYMAKFFTLPPIP